MEGNDDDDDEEEEEGLFAPMIHTFEARARLSLETRVYTHTHTRRCSPSFFLSFLGVCGCCCALVVKMCVWSIG